MFTGLIEEVGVISAIRKGQHSAVLTIQAKEILSDVKIGDSIAVNGVCLTCAALGTGTFSADVMHETLNFSALGGLKPGSRVNLERAMPAYGRFGGHIVAGHADGTGRVRSVEKDDNAIRYTIEAEPGIMKYIVAKGSITVDGVSLTVARLYSDAFVVSIIPHTVAVTTFSDRKAGDKVNLENDIVGKYVERLMNFSKEEVGEGGKADGKPGGLTREKLLEFGF